MLFTKEIAVSTAKTKADPEIATLKIAHGIVTWVSVLFPTGCHQLVHCIILHHEHQIFPSTDGMTLTGDTFPIEWNEYYESYQPPYELKLKLWSEGASYSHTVTVRVAVLPRKAVAAASIAEAIKGVFQMFMPRRVPLPKIR